MKILNYVSTASVPFFLLLIISYGFIEKNNVFDNFVDGVKEGMKIIYNLFPTLLGLFLAVGMLRTSGFIDLIINFLAPVFNFFHLPKEIMPLAILRPISGSAATAVATDIMNKYGVDTIIGKIAATIMGSTETTLYTIAIYTSCVKIRKNRGIIIAALFGDLIGIIVSISICNIIF